MGLLVKRIDEGNILVIVLSLAKTVTSGKQPQEREISSLGLKAVVAELPSGKSAISVVKALTPTLVTALDSKVRCNQLYCIASSKATCFKTIDSQSLCFNTDIKKQEAGRAFECGSLKARLS